MLRARWREALLLQGARWGTFVIALVMAGGVIQFYQPPKPLVRAPFGAEAGIFIPAAEPAPSALGKSGAVQMRFSLPGDPVSYPLEVQGDPSSLAYEWLRFGDSARADSARALAGERLVAPSEPGFYRLALVRGSVRRMVDGMTLAVLVPFEDKHGSSIDGYRIGTFLAERLGDGTERPEGFVRVTAADADVPITKHLRVGDFLTRDGQTQWPRYAAISPRVVDKLELVVAAVARTLGDSGRVPVALNVHSAFRTPLYNGYNRFARDSRHQYGDAIDVAIDANGDGRLTASDTKLVARAVDTVEGEHPDLVGGLGVYTSRKYNQPYVHIDARGIRARWRG